MELILQACRATRWVVVECHTTAGRATKVAAMNLRCMKLLHGHHHQRTCSEGNLRSGLLP